MRKLVYFSFLLLIAFQVKAQESNISYNLTPTVNYTWWDSNLLIKDGPMVGGMFGIGLGRNLELRALYEQSVNLKSTLNGLNMPIELIDKFDPRDVDINRWGGELKAIIPIKSLLSPYFTIGTGVQKMKFDGIKEDQIYLSGGLGGSLSLSERVTLNFGGKVHAFNQNPVNLLRTDTESVEYNDWNDWIDENISNERMLNWSLNVGLQVILGGKNPKTYTALDRAVASQYNRGLSGLRFVFEPGGAYINFDSSTNFLQHLQYIQKVVLILILIALLTCVILTC